MRRSSFAAMRCSVAQCLEVVGEWWTLLILRDAMLGVRRFDEFQSRLGISRNILQERLTRLVDCGVMERVAYQERPPRFDYLLTPRGRDLWPVIAAMRQWGDTWAAPDGPPLDVVHRSCGERTRVDPVCSCCGETLELGDLVAVPGPGAVEGDELIPGGG